MYIFYSQTPQTPIVSRTTAYVSIQKTDYVREVQFLIAFLQHINTCSSRNTYALSFWIGPNMQTACLAPRAHREDRAQQTFVPVFWS